LEETFAMWNQTGRLYYGAGLELLSQEYRADLLELMICPGLNKIERLRLSKALTDRYMLQRTEEREAVTAQLRDDYEASLERK
jgi:hypothetical protein